MARRRQSVTIRHVADDAGVSLQTVSRVINKEPNVRPAMKQKVQESIDWLVSVFTDNAGMVRFDENLNLVYKVAARRNANLCRSRLSHDGRTSRYT